MLAYRYPLIAREGWRWISVVLVVAGMTAVFFPIASIPLWALLLLLVFLFRDPHRKVPALPLGVVCPVDGRVIAVEKVRDNYLERSAICISIKMGLTSVYSVHNPMEGKIIKQWLDTPRKIQSANSETAQSSAPEVLSFAQWVQSDEEDDVVMVVESNKWIPRPHCYAHSGERIGQGQRCGFLRFGTQVDVLIPESSRVEAKAGERVLGGANVLATLVHETLVQGGDGGEVTSSDSHLETQAAISK